MLSAFDAFSIVTLLVAETTSASISLLSVKDFFCPSNKVTLVGIAKYSCNGWLKRIANNETRRTIPAVFLNGIRFIHPRSSFLGYVFNFAGRGSLYNLSGK